MRMDLYGDFTCPHCKMLHEQILPKIMRDYVTPGKAYLVFHEYTLTGPGHQHSQDGIALCRCRGARSASTSRSADALFATQVLVGAERQGLGSGGPGAQRRRKRRRCRRCSKTRRSPPRCSAICNMGMAAHVDRTPTMIMTHKGKQTPWSYWERLRAVQEPGGC